MLQSVRKIILLLLLLIPLLMVSCQSEYLATFDDIGTWAQDDRIDVVGGVVEGQYVMQVLKGGRPQTYWATADESFDNGVLEADVTQLNGTLNAGFGLGFRVNAELGQFYLFEVSGDGYAWVGLCKNGCLSESDQLALLGSWWFPAAAIRQGLNETNQLRVIADGPNMTFFVNGIEIGRIQDDALASGDIAIVTESLGQGGLTVAFDNVRISPLDN